MDTVERNKQAKQFILNKIDLVEGKDKNILSNIENHESLLICLDDLIKVKAKGFRGVVATAITGMHLNSEFNPLNEFYSCNPRSIFEQGIFYAFQEANIPCGKSDPLNVAKNVNYLNNEWANGKRPEKAAKAAVEYLTLIVDANDSEKEKLINLFFLKLVQYSREVANIKIKIPKDNNLSQQEIARKLIQFTLQYPESGTIPQLVIASLLKKVYELSKTSVKGGDESVFGTNTTSKKPADIWLEDDNEPFKLFEITVKKIDRKRLDDCIDSLISVGHIDKPVDFICRIPDDITSLDGIESSTLTYKNKKFCFVDISTFIHSSVSLISCNQLNEILLELREFITLVERPITTKDGWNKIFSL